MVFSVAATRHEAYSRYERVRFHEMITSVGGGWDNTTNTFTCPVAGLYLFALHLHRANNYDNFNAYLRKEEEHMAYLSNYVNPSNPTATSLSSGITVNLQCEVGEKVWVQLGVYSGSLAGGIHQLFSGVLLHKT